jgi:dihydroxy-acid dehydratase
MEDVHKVGGTPALLKYLHAKGFIDGSCLTVTGRNNMRVLSVCVCVETVLKLCTC